MNNPLKYTDPSGYIHSHYWQKGGGDEDGIPGGGGGSFGGAGYGINGTGLNGTYYDWYSGTMRTTDTGSSVGWGYASSVYSRYTTSLPANTNLGSIHFENNNGVGGVWYRQDAYGGSGNYMVYKDSRWRFTQTNGGGYVESPTGVDNNGLIFGLSEDITIATPWFGYTFEGTDIGMGKNAKSSISHGIAYGGELSAGVNLVFIIPLSNAFKIGDIEGTSYAFTGNYSLFSFSISGNSTPGYPEDSFGDTYISIKLGFGLGFGGSTSKTKTTFYNRQDYNIPFSPIPGW